MWGKRTVVCWDAGRLVLVLWLAGMLLPTQTRGTQVKGVYGWCRERHGKERETPRACGRARWFDGWRSCAVVRTLQGGDVRSGFSVSSAPKVYMLRTEQCSHTPL